jgi:hypothetical protein
MDYESEARLKDIKVGDIISLATIYSRAKQYKTLQGYYVPIIVGCTKALVEEIKHIQLDIYEITLSRLNIPMPEDGHTEHGTSRHYVYWNLGEKLDLKLYGNSYLREYGIYIP